MLMLLFSNNPTKCQKVSLFDINFPTIGYFAFTLAWARQIHSSKDEAEKRSQLFGLVL